MRINTNMNALVTQRNMQAVGNNLSKSLERLSSGLRVNTAADDASGIARSETARAQIRGMNVAERNIQDGMGLLNTAEGALAQVQSILLRMRELSVTASNGTLQDTPDRASLQAEFAALGAEMDRIRDTTTFNGKKVFEEITGFSPMSGTTATDPNTITATDQAVEIRRAAFRGGAYSDGTTTFDRVRIDDTVETTNTTVTPRTGDPYDTFSLQIGPNNNAEDRLALTTAKLDFAFALGTDDDTATGDFDSAGPVDFTPTAPSIGTEANARQMITSIDDYLAYVTNQRTAMGAQSNRLEAAQSILQITRENLQAVDSRIRDTDVAMEMTNLTKQQILMQTSTAILAQANAQPQSVLSLFK
ncbi:MAG: flagellin [Candidatus Sericytochromatia bacterium]|nr:flagellin [Candidatus Sericytochromatia bacterium]